ncbi:hypothetical protein MMC31_003023, partial [Peltigera leucophlebia]|nr:hypothetical protein [Peltigera leucophlebia]
MGLVTTEVLVHVSAPSRPTDDTRYRREAQEYLRFDAACRHSVLNSDDDDTRLEGLIAPERCGESPLARRSLVSSSQEQRTGHQSGTLATREVKGCARSVPRNHIVGRASRNSSEVLIESPLAARVIAARQETAEALESGNHGAEGDMPGCNPPDSFGESFISDAGLAALETPAPRTVVTSTQEIKTALPPKKDPMHSGRPFETPSAVRGPFLFEHTPISITPWSNIPRAKTLFSIDVVRTPDYPPPRPRTAPGDHMTSVQKDLLLPRRTQSESDSWETPSAVIPDSQPSPLSLKRSSQLSSGCDSTNTRHEKKLHVERFSTPV